MKRVLGIFHQFVMNDNQVFYAVRSSVYRIVTDAPGIPSRFKKMAERHNLPGVLTPATLVSHPDFNPEKYFHEVYLCDSNDIAIWMLTPESQLGNSSIDNYFSRFYYESGARVVMLPDTKSMFTIGVP